MCFRKNISASFANSYWVWQWNQLNQITLRTRKKKFVKGSSVRTNKKEKNPVYLNSEKKDRKKETEQSSTVTKILVKQFPTYFPFDSRIGFWSMWVCVCVCVLWKTVKVNNGEYDRWICINNSLAKLGWNNKQSGWVYSKNCYSMLQFHSSNCSPLWRYHWA